MLECNNCKVPCEWETLHTCSCRMHSCINAWNMLALLFMNTICIILICVFSKNNTCIEGCCKASNYNFFTGTFCSGPINKKGIMSVSKTDMFFLFWSLSFPLKKKKEKKKKKKERAKISQHASSHDRVFFDCIQMNFSMGIIKFWQILTEFVWSWHYNTK